jgi:E3 ubiquitin-protein ligase DOA10
LLQPLEVPSAV